jgi:hypothetical protein
MSGAEQQRSEPGLLAHPCLVTPAATTPIFWYHAHATRSHALRCRAGPLRGERRATCACVGLSAAGGV